MYLRGNGSSVCMIFRVEQYSRGYEVNNRFIIANCSHSLQIEKSMPKLGLITYFFVLDPLVWPKNKYLRVLVWKCERVLLKVGYEANERLQAHSVNAVNQNMAVHH